MDINNLNEAKSLVIKFRDSEFLNGKIENLENFSFWNFFDIESDFKIKESAKIFVGNYDKPNKFDGDRIPITYAIDKLLYTGKDIKNFDGNLGKIYTGDTINTFNTLFGNRFYYNEQSGKIENRQIIVQERYNFPAELIKKRDMFFFKYQSFGNFYLLPTEPRATSLNVFRSQKWNDFFDLFLKHLELCLGKNDFESEMSQILQHENSSLFFKDLSIEDFKTIFFLGMYTNWTLDHPIYLFHQNYTHKTIADSELCKNYCDFCIKYIDAATEKITLRSKILVDEIKNLL